MRAFCLFLSILLVAACSGLGDAPPDASEVISAERAFAAEAQEIGWVAAFERFSTPEAIVLGARPRNAHEAMAGIDPAARADRSLVWAPSFAGVSRGGDIGFTTGPFSAGDAAFGQYFTVWRRQDDGAWKWIYDGGVGQATPTRPDPAAEVEQLAVGARGAGSSAAALEAVHRREEALAAAAAENAGEAYAEVFAATGRMNRDDAATAVGPEQAARLAGSGGVRFSPPQMAEAGLAGDLVFTLGEARWDAGAGYYQRIWVLQREGWRIGYDQILNRPLEETAPPPSPEEAPDDAP